MAVFVWLCVTHTHTPVIIIQVYTVTLHGEQLRTDFRVINNDDKPFDFTTALHTYIEVQHVKDAKVGVCAGGSLTHCWVMMHLGCTHYTHSAVTCVLGMDLFDAAE